MCLGRPWLVFNEVNLLPSAYGLCWLIDLDCWVGRAYIYLLSTVLPIGDGVVTVIVTVRRSLINLAIAKLPYLHHSPSENARRHGGAEETPATLLWVSSCCGRSQGPLCEKDRYQSSVARESARLRSVVVCCPLCIVHFCVSLYTANPSRIAQFSFLAKFFWANAGFDCLRTIKDLDRYTERWDVK